MGDTFDFVTKHKSHAAIAEKYDLKIEDVQPAKYDGEDGEITYIPPEKLIELGLGKAHGGRRVRKGRLGGQRRSLIGAVNCTSGA